MTNLIITNPTITIETEAEKALINKLYPRATIMDTRHAFLPDKFTLEELSDLKAKLALADKLIQAGNFEVAQIRFGKLNRAQAVYLQNRSDNNIIYTYEWDEVCDIKNCALYPDTRGPWWAEVNEILTQEQVNILYRELNKLK